MTIKDFTEFDIWQYRFFLMITSPMVTSGHPEYVSDWIVPCLRAEVSPQDDVVLYSALVQNVSGLRHKQRNRSRYYQQSYFITAGIYSEVLEYYQATRYR